MWLRVLTAGVSLAGVGAAFAGIFMLLTWPDAKSAIVLAAGLAAIVAARLTERIALRQSGQEWRRYGPRS